MEEAEDALRDYQRQLERVFNEVRELEKYAAEASESVESYQMLPPGPVHRGGQGGSWPASVTLTWPSRRGSPCTPG